MTQSSIVNRQSSIAADRRRRARLAKLHIAKKQIGLDDAAYRAMLRDVAGVDSAKDLTPAGFGQVFRHLTQCGLGGRRGGPACPPSYPGRPAGMEDLPLAAQLEKIEALLTDMQLPWAYANTILKKQSKGACINIRFCNDSGLLQGVIAALVRRQQKTTGRRVD